MGRDVPALTFTREDRRRYRIKMQECLDALAQMLRESRFEAERPQVGLEIELNLVDGACRPAMANSEVLEKIDDPSFTLELGQHNLEVNVPPRELAGDETLDLEKELVSTLASADVKAHDAGTSIVMIGVLPTLRHEHFDRRWLSQQARYTILNDRILAARGEEVVLSMEGAPMPGRAGERLSSYAESIMPEAACTSVQLHLQVDPLEGFGVRMKLALYGGIAIAIGGSDSAVIAVFGKVLAPQTQSKIIGSS